MDSEEEFHDDLQHDEELQVISNGGQAFGVSNGQNNSHRPVENVQQEEVHSDILIK